MNVTVPEEFLASLARVYGEDCKTLFLALIREASPGTDLQVLVEDAVMQTYERHFAGAKQGEEGGEKVRHFPHGAS